jgi:hypothetical protein
MDNENTKNIIKKIYDKYGTYNSLKKDIKILKYFMNHPNEKNKTKNINTTL